jgi:hypothetical protein
MVVAHPQQHHPWATIKAYNALSNVAAWEECQLIDFLTHSSQENQQVEQQQPVSSILPFS